jgi:integrase
MAQLRKREGIAARALEFTILTCARSGEIYEAKRSEIDFTAQLWTIPEIIKGGRSHEHRVPLSDRAMEIVSELPLGDFLFSDGGHQLEAKAMLKELRRMGYVATVHGFRSAFRTWSAETTAYPRELCEMVLSHKIGDGETERSYQRGEMLDKRRRLMSDWATFCNTPPAIERDNVRPSCKSLLVSMLVKALAGSYRYPIARSGSTNGCTTALGSVLLSPSIRPATRDLC